MKYCQEQQERNPSSWWANQLCNQNNARAHRENTGREISKQLDGKIDAWVASIGTGGTFLGVAEALKEDNPELISFGILPTDDPRIQWVRSGAVHTFLDEFGLPPMRFLIEDILEKELLDNEVAVKNEDALNMANRLCREEGLFCGMSSGANVWAAVELAKTLPEGSTIVTVLVDRRDRYFSEFPNEHYIV